MSDSSPYYLITLIGLPLSGKTTSLKHYHQSHTGSRAIYRSFGYEGFGGRELSILVPSYDSKVLFLRTFPGAIWSSCSWKFLLGESDGIIYVVDSQDARSKDQGTYDSFVKKAVDQSIFSSGDVPILCQLNKADLTSDKRLSILKEHYSNSVCNPIVTTASRCEGLDEVLSRIVSIITQRNINRKNGLERDMALKYSAWDPFK